MAKNFVQEGETVTVAAPTGGCKSGDFVIVGSLAGVAASDAAEATDVEVTVEGVWTLPKAAGAITQGAKVYWDTTAKDITATATGNTLIGAATEAAGSAATTIRVRLNGVSV